MNEVNDTPKLMVENISCILPENKEFGGLFLGNVYGAQNAQILKQYGIRAIITASIETKLNHSFIDIPFQLKIEAHDKDDYYITQHINECIHFIEQKRKNTNVFVHCFAGVSRSTAIVAAYLMWKYRWTLQKTMRFLTFKRIAAKPNDGFYRQLKDIQAKLNIVGQNKPQIMTHPFNGQSSQRENIVTKTPTIQLNPNQLGQSAQRFHISKDYSGISASPLKLANLQSDSIAQSNPANQHLLNTQPAIRQFSLDGISSTVFQKGNNPQSFSLKNKSKRSQIVSQRQYKNHSQIPIPKVLQKRNSINNTVGKNNGFQDINQQINTTISKYMSPDVVPSSPPRPIHQKMSIGKKSIVSLNHNSRYSNTTDRQIQNNQTLNIRDKQIMEWKQKSKTSSRCFIRPKDLPGYKNY